MNRWYQVYATDTYRYRVNTSETEVRSWYITLSRHCNWKIQQAAHTSLAKVCSWSLLAGLALEPSNAEFSACMDVATRTVYSTTVWSGLQTKPRPTVTICNVFWTNDCETIDQAIQTDWISGSFLTHGRGWKRDLQELLRGERDTVCNCTQTRLLWP